MRHSAPAYVGKIGKLVMITGAAVSLGAEEILLVKTGRNI